MLCCCWAKCASVDRSLMDRNHCFDPCTLCVVYTRWRQGPLQTSLPLPTVCCCNKAPMHEGLGPTRAVCSSHKAGQGGRTAHRVYNTAQLVITHNPLQCNPSYGGWLTARPATPAGSCTHWACTVWGSRPPTRDYTTDSLQPPIQIHQIQVPDCGSFAPQPASMHTDQKALEPLDDSDIADLNDVTLEEYKQSVLDAVQEDAQMLSSDSPAYFDPLDGEWQQLPPRPRGPVHKWSLNNRFGSFHQQEQAYFDEFESAPLLDMSEKPLYDIITDVPLVTKDVRFEEEYKALEEMLDDPDFLRELQSWDPAYLDPPYKGLRAIHCSTATHAAQVHVRSCTGPHATCLTTSPGGLGTPSTERSRVRFTCATCRSRRGSRTMPCSTLRASSGHGACATLSCVGQHTPCPCVERHCNDIATTTCTPAKRRLSTRLQHVAHVEVQV